MKLSTGAALMLVLVASGCTTNETIVASTPVSTVISAKSVSAVADCIYSAAVGVSEGLDIRKTTAGEVVHVSADEGQRDLALYDVAVQPSNPGSVVHIRAAGNVWGGTNEPSELHRIVDRCAQ